MSDLNGFHPDLTTTGAEHGTASLRTRVHHVRASDVSSGTAQTAGMRRFAAMSGGSVGSGEIWMGETDGSPEAGVGQSHHGGTAEAGLRANGESAVRIPRCRTGMST